MLPCLHQRNAYIKRKVRVCRIQKCIPLVGVKTSLSYAGLQTTPSQVNPYRAENGNLRKSGSTFCHCTMFAPKQCLYKKEATDTDRTKMYSSRRCKKLTYLCGTANDLIWGKSVYGWERKFAEILVYPLPRHRVCTKAMFISKGTYGYGESKNVFL